MFREESWGWSLLTHSLCPIRPQPHTPLGTLVLHGSPSGPTDPRALRQGLDMSQLSFLPPNGLQASPFRPLLPKVYPWGGLLVVS